MFSRVMQPEEGENGCYVTTSGGMALAAGFCTSVRREGTGAVQGRKPGWERDKEGVVNIVNEFH